MHTVHRRRAEDETGTYQEQPDGRNRRRRRVGARVARALSDECIRRHAGVSERGTRLKSCQLDRLPRGAMASR
eukprot:3819366-Pleurochrysis_carterae.AAC.3